MNLANQSSVANNVHVVFRTNIFGCVHEKFCPNIFVQKHNERSHYKLID